MNIKNYLWLLPFISFLCGYGVIQWFFHIESIPTPHLIGHYVHEILPIISQHTLHVRLISQKEESDIPEGIIINQSPQPGKAIKPHQPLFIVTTKKPQAMQSPNCLQKKIGSVLPGLHTAGIFPRIYTVAHQYPEGICFAQTPQPEEFLEKNKLILYVSAGNNKPILWPNFIETSLEKTSLVLDMYSMKPYIINDSPFLQKSIDSYTVIDQRPLAGTLVTLDEKKPISVQLRIQ